ncbi:LysR family transcriptional regulator [Rhizobium sp. LEGMi135b]
MDWNDLRFFLAVANSRSLSAASRQLGVSTSTVSRRVAVLEESLGVKLFRHHADGYEVTEAGKELRLPAEQAEAHLRAFERAARETNDPLSGTVRIDAPELLGQQLLIPSLSSFVADYPAIKLDMRSNVHPTQLATQRSDIVIRIVQPDRGSYRMRTVGKVVFGYFASQSYVARYGAPSSYRDLSSHRLVGWSEELSYLSMAVWMEEVTVGRVPDMRYNTFIAHLIAVENGLGIGILPMFAARRAGLIPVVHDIPKLTLDLWLLVQDQAAKISRVQLVKDRLIKILVENADNLSGTDTKPIHYVDRH